MERYLGTFERWLIVPVILTAIAFATYYLLKRHGWKQRQATGFALITPWLVGFIIFTAFPLIYSLYLSFTDYSLFGKPKWVGLKNYIWLFTKDVEFWPSVKITLLYAALTVPIGVIGSLLVALLLNKKVKGIGVFRTIYYLPAVLPEVAVALLWRWLFNSDSGLLNYFLSPILKLFGLGKPNWFGDPKFVLPAFVIMSVWGIFGTNTVVFLAGLQGVPKSLYEVADLDGASSYKKFKYITAPQISPIILLQIIMGMISSLQIFTVAMFVRPTTAAGKFMNQLIYERGFTQLHMGEASAVAWVLFVIILALTLLVFRSTPAWVYYEAEVKR
ncbi:MAG TPA: ABC transporter permease [Clostridiaceae bacterium]|nr:ABC transporter permease [Clostridiaceae bacterium]HBF77941.1 ABC transporter permease [Clostridiaceae bacterium]HBG38301.1 ABC transporter permease [Clostridiaceae bacterium]HBN28009.1 ABC transporter permease [Clostridiaceae bacterium]HBX48692.1 ABC transporter permease [Clostridiaceae bacterium]